MLNNIALLVVLLAVMQAPLPLPGQTPDAGTTTAQQSSQKTSATENLLTEIPAHVVPGPTVAGTTGQNAAQSRTNGNEDHPVTVTKFPSVSVERDLIDTAMLLLNVGLLAVGSFGVWAALRTLNQVKRQADLMERQIDDARNVNEANAKDVQASIAEAVRSAKAMEGVAESMAINAASVKESVAISRQIAETQKLATVLHSRAYLSAGLDGAFFQDESHVFEVRAFLRNHGNTPAYDVTFRSTVQIIESPIPDDFSFPLPDETAGTSVSLMGPGTVKLIPHRVPSRVPEEEVEDIKRGRQPRVLAMWGAVRYRDAFENFHSLKFAFVVYWIGWVPGKERDKDGNLRPEQVMSVDTARHNEAD